MYCFFFTFLVRVCCWNWYMCGKWFNWNDLDVDLILINLIFWWRLHIVTARKQSLGQGNVFTPVCHSVHTGGLCLGGVSVQWGSLSGGWSLSTQVSVQGVSVQGSLCPGGSLSRGLSVKGALCQEDPQYSNERAVRILMECIVASSCCWQRQISVPLFGSCTHFSMKTIEYYELFWSLLQL